ncbi:MAG: 1-deoxy-D-xylulose-5-phosphate reductoisomerase [Pseudomonadota bacterium]
MRRRVSILGSTGSIGQNTVDLLTRQGGAESYDVVAITGARNTERLAEQARALNAALAVTADPACYDDLKARLAGTGTEVAAGPDAVIEAAGRPADWIMSAIVGSAGLAPTLAALDQGTTVALANKESLVCAGELVHARIAKTGARMLPVDSEHSAIFQALNGEAAKDVDRVILTASGGPFRGWTLDQMACATVDQALAHPNWVMGQRISIDSATMFNKALEVIEAKYLFNLAADQIEVIVHPQSIVHSMVGYADGSILAQLGPPDMRGAIGYALNYPERLPLPVDRLDFATLATLDFHAPDDQRFPALRLAREVTRKGGLSGAVLNAAKEAALDAFLSRRIEFLTMARLVETTLERLPYDDAASTAEIGLSGVIGADRAARVFVEGLIADGMR